MSSEAESRNDRESHSSDAGASWWKPTTLDELQEIVADEIAQMTALESALFERIRVPPCVALLPRGRAGKAEPVFVVARFGSDVLYFDDVEWGFERSPIDAENRILHPTANQFTLREALARYESTLHPVSERE